MPFLKRLLPAALTLAIVWGTAASVLALWVYLYGLVDFQRPADVIVVLGAGLNRSDAPGPALTRRTLRAAALWHQGVAPYVLCTGGTGWGRSRSEASACAALLQSAGVPPDRILLEERSRSTEENALYTRDILDAHGWQTVVLVSDGFHMLRAVWIFAQQGITVYSSPVPASEVRKSVLAASLLREVLALHWQALKTALNLPFTAVPGL